MNVITSFVTWLSLKGIVYPQADKENLNPLFNDLMSSLYTHKISSHYKDGGRYSCRVNYCMWSRLHSTTTSWFWQMTVFFSSTLMNNRISSWISTAMGRLKKLQTYAWINTNVTVFNDLFRDVKWNWMNDLCCYCYFYFIYPIK